MDSDGKSSLFIFGKYKELEWNVYRGIFEELLFLFTQGEHSSRMELSEKPIFKMNSTNYTISGTCEIFDNSTIQI